MALVNPNIAMSFRAPEMPQQNALADYAAVQQIQSGQRQAEVSQMQLDQMRRDETTLKQIQAKSIEGGGPIDLNKIAEAYLNSGNPKFVEFGVGLRQKLDEHAQITKIMGMGSTPAPAMPNVAPASGALGSGTFDPNAPVAAPMPTMAQRSATATGTNLPPIGATNRLAPAPAAPVNQLAPGGLDLNTLLNQQNAFMAMGKPEMARALDAKITLASRQQPETIREMQACS